MAPEDLLDTQTYSGVRTDLEEIMTLLGRGRAGTATGSEAAPGGISAVDSSLLSFNSFLLQEDLEHHVLEKIKAVQVGTSKRVISMFHKNVVLADACVQTGFNDDLLIKDLTFRNNQLRSDLDEANQHVAQE